MMLLRDVLEELGAGGRQSGGVAVFQTPPAYLSPVIFGYYDEFLE